MGSFFFKENEINKNTIINEQFKTHDNDETDEETKIKFIQVQHSDCMRKIYCTKRNSIIKNSHLQSSTTDLPILDETKIFLLEYLGEGGFGVVQKAYDKTKNEFIALKKFKSIEEFTQEKFEAIMLEDDLLQSVEEIRNSQNQNQQYFLKYDGVYRNVKNCGDLTLRMEYGRATLGDILRAGKKYPCAELVSVLLKIAKAFAILEENGIANCDVKPSNIILVEDPNEENTFYYKISDFGVGCKLERGISTVAASEISGVTREYAAPEVLRLFEKKSKNNDVYNPFLGDVFSLGIIAIKMIDYDLGRKNLNMFSQERILPGYEKIINLLQMMIEEDPQKRCSFKDIVKFLNENKIVSKNPTDESEYCRKWQIEIKEKQMENSYSDLKRLYEEHETMFFCYQNKVTRPKEAKFHLDRCKDVLARMQEKIKTNGSQEKKWKVLEKKIQNLNNFGEWFRGIGDLKLSEKNLIEAMKKIEEIRMKYELDIINGMRINELEGNVFNNFAKLNFNMGSLRKSEEFFLKSLKIRKKLFGKKHLDVANTLNNLGSLYVNMDYVQKAKRYYRKSLKIYEELLGENHSDVAMSLNNLGHLFNNMGNFAEAEEFYLKSLKIHQNLFGENHSNVATSLNNLGSLYDNMGNFQKAKDYYMKSLKIRQNIFGENHSDVAQSLNNLSYIYESLNKKELALIYAKNAFIILVRLYGNSHKKTIAYFNHHQELLSRKMNEI